MPTPYSGTEQMPTQSYSGTEQMPTPSYSGTEQMPTQSYSGTEQMPTQSYSGTEQLPTQSYSGTEQSQAGHGRVLGASSFCIRYHLRLSDASQNSPQSFLLFSKHSCYQRKAMQVTKGILNPGQLSLAH